MQVRRANPEPQNPDFTIFDEEWSKIHFLNHCYELIKNAYKSGENAFWFDCIAFVDEHGRSFGSPPEDLPKRIRVINPIPIQHFEEDYLIKLYNDVATALEEGDEIQLQTLMSQHKFVRGEYPAVNVNHQPFSNSILKFFEKRYNLAIECDFDNELSEHIHNLNLEIGKLFEHDPRRAAAGKVLANINTLRAAGKGYYRDKESGQVVTLADVALTTTKMISTNNPPEEVITGCREMAKIISRSHKMRLLGESLAGLAFIVLSAALAVASFLAFPFLPVTIAAGAVAGASLAPAIVSAVSIFKCPAAPLRMRNGMNELVQLMPAPQR